jgi:Fe-S-cluster containining protein
VLLLGDIGVPGHLTETDALGAEVMARCEDGWCAALERQTLRCSIYDRRPWICRQLAMGGKDCVDARETCVEE